jgi:hypothetical protein
MGILVTLILSYIIVGIMSLYAINLDAVSLFADSSFMFLAVLNDVLCRFEWINIILFLLKKKDCGLGRWNLTTLYIVIVGISNN